MGCLCGYTAAMASVAYNVARTAHERTGVHGRGGCTHTTPHATCTALHKGLAKIIASCQLPIANCHPRPSSAILRTSHRCHRRWQDDLSYILQRWSNRWAEERTDIRLRQEAASAAAAMPPAPAGDSDAGSKQQPSAEHLLDLT